MTEKEKSEIRRMIENDQSAGAMKECIAAYRKSYMPIAMQMRGYYDAMINVGFKGDEALSMTLGMLSKMIDRAV